jgi:hypothetical protein
MQEKLSSTPMPHRHRMHPHAARRARNKIRFASILGCRKNETCIFPADSRTFPSRTDDGDNRELSPLHRCTDDGTGCPAIRLFFIPNSAASHFARCDSIEVRKPGRRCRRIERSRMQKSDARYLAEKPRSLHKKTGRLMAAGLGVASAASRSAQWSSFSRSSA